MATTKQEFVEVAREIFEEFSDFLAPATFKDQGSVNRETGKTDKRKEQVVNGIETEVDYSVFDRRLVQVSDAMQLYKYTDFSWLPSPGKATVTMNGEQRTIVNRVVDPAKAVVIILARAL